MPEKTAKQVNDAVKNEFRLIPLSFVIKKVYNAEQKKEVFFFDNGVYPNARRFYVDRNLIDFLTSKTLLQRLNSRLFCANSIQFSNVVINERETTIVKLGDKMLNAFAIRIPINSEKLIAEIENSLENTNENVVIDYDKITATDNVYFNIVVAGKPNETINVTDMISIRLTSDGIKLPFAESEEKAEQNTKRTVRYNKAGIRILK